MVKRTKEQIVAEETSKFMGSNFGQLDLSGSPDINNPPAEEQFELQDRHGFNRVDESGLAGINQLKVPTFEKQNITNINREAQAFLAEKAVKYSKSTLRSMRVVLSLTLGWAKNCGKG